MVDGLTSAESAWSLLREICKGFQKEVRKLEREKGLPLPLPTRTGLSASLGPFLRFSLPPVKLDTFPAETWNCSY